MPQALREEDLTRSRELGKRIFPKELSLVFGSITRLKIHSTKRCRRLGRRCVETPFAGREFDAF